MNSKEIGNKAEILVAQYLIQKGYNIISKNYYCQFGEIYIIAEFNCLIIAVEVKKIPQNWDICDLQYKISSKKILNIKKTFSVYLAQNNHKKYNNIRFDVAIVTDDRIKYFEGAF